MHHVACHTQGILVDECCLHLRASNVQLQGGRVDASLGGWEEDAYAGGREKTPFFWAGADCTYGIISWRSGETAQIFQNVSVALSFVQRVTQRTFTLASEGSQAPCKYSFSRFH
jgi:hypothetical protein